MTRSTHKHRGAYATAALLALLMLGSFAQAEIISSPILILDAGDGNRTIHTGNDGEVLFVGSLGDWFLNITKGEQEALEFELESLDIGLFNHGRLDITLIGYGFFGWPGLNVSFAGSLVSLLPSKMSYTVLVNDQVAGELGPFSGLYFEEGLRGISMPPDAGGPYTIAQTVSIWATGPASALFKAEVTPTPEPSTLLLVGCVLLFGAKFAGRRFARRS
ncbi:MAG: hypothetical protein ACM3ZB_01080 [bacterium]